MYSCKACGGNIKFDIPSQKLKCDHCNNLYNPYEVEKESDAEESKLFNVTVFTCPQCGAEIMASENSTAEFCIYCGGSTILSSRISQEKCPDYLITFKKTKEDCIKAYKNLMRRALFVPSALKKPEHLNKFRAIYMPYWTYQVEQKGPVELLGKKTYRSGDYIITDHYSLSCELDAAYRGFSHDASSYFEDNITEALAPYNVSEMQSFTPSLLSGFYADTSDVRSESYVNESVDFANEVTLHKLKNNYVFKDYSISYSDDSNMSNILNTKSLPADSTMYPVWFLSYQNKEKVLYASVNGQTGKVVADLPIDRGKYIFGSILLAIPLFFLLNLFFIFRPVVSMYCATVLNVITMIIYAFEIIALANFDKVQTVNGVKTISKVRFSVKITLGKTIQTILICGVVFLFTCAVLVQLPFELSSFFPLLPLVINIFLFIKARKKIEMFEELKNFQRDLSSYYVSMVATIIAFIISVVNPVADWWYYGATILSAGSMLYSIFEIIRQNNVLSTHKVPELHDRGGVWYEKN